MRRHLYEVTCKDRTPETSDTMAILNEVCGKRDLTPTDDEHTFHIQLSVAEFKQIRAKGCQVQRVKLKKSKLELSEPRPIVIRTDKKQRRRELAW